MKEEPYFDKKGKQIKEFALLKFYHFKGVNEQGRGRKHYYMYKLVQIKDGGYCALHLTKNLTDSFWLKAVANKETRVIEHAEIIQSY